MVMSFIVIAVEATKQLDIHILLELPNDEDCVTVPYHESISVHFTSTNLQGTVSGSSADLLMAKLLLWFSNFIRYKVKYGHPTSNFFSFPPPQQHGGGEREWEFIRL